MKKKKTLFYGLIMAVIVIAALVPRLERIQKRHIMTYLNEKYTGEEFEISKKDSYFQVIPSMYPSVTFTVGKTSDGDFYDDYPRQLLWQKADELGISWKEAKDRRIGEYLFGGGIIVTYENYKDLDELADQLEALLEECRPSQAFTENTFGGLGGWNIEVRWEKQEDSIFPGYTFPIIQTEPQEPEAHKALKELQKDAGLDTEPAGQNSNTSTLAFEKRLEKEGYHLAEKIKLFHIYYVYNYSVTPQDELIFPEEDMQLYQTLCPGTVLTDSDGKEYTYPLVETDSWGGLKFGGAYQVLKEEGCEITIEKDGFTATGNGHMVTITLGIHDNLPSYSWNYEGISGNSNRNEFYKQSISGDVIWELTGKETMGCNVPPMD